jgi:hypothetical protein
MRVSVMDSALSSALDAYGSLPVQLPDSAIRGLHVTRPLRTRYAANPRRYLCFAVTRTFPHACAHVRMRAHVHAHACVCARAQCVTCVTQVTTRLSARNTLRRWRNTRARAPSFIPPSQEKSEKEGRDSTYRPSTACKAFDLRANPNWLTMAVAMTRTAQNVQRANVQETRAKFDRPTSFTPNSIYVEPANKDGPPMSAGPCTARVPTPPYLGPSWKAFIKGNSKHVTRAFWKLRVESSSRQVVTHGHQGAAKC